MNLSDFLYLHTNHRNEANESLSLVFLELRYNKTVYFKVIDSLGLVYLLRTEQR